MKLNIAFNYNIDIQDCKLNSVLAAFNEIITVLLNMFAQEVLEKFANHYMALKRKSLSFVRNAAIKMKSCASYLRNAQPDMFSGIRNKSGCRFEMFH